MGIAAKAVAVTADGLLNHPEKAKKIQEKFKEQEKD
jgi:hypothetical protein